MFVNLQIIFIAKTNLILFLIIFHFFLYFKGFHHLIRRLMEDYFNNLYFDTNILKTKLKILH
jgi:hypothetical protein